VVGLAQYFARSTAPELEELSQSQQPEGEMSAKRARTSSSAGTTTTSAFARRRGPVAPAVKQYVKGCMDRLLEIKSYNTAVIDTVPGPAGALLLVPVEDIIQGDGDNERSGNLIHIKRVKFNYTIFDNVSALVRFIWFVDRQSNGTTPTLTQVLQSASFTSVYNTTNVIGNGGQRFWIVADETKIVNPGTAVTTALPLQRKTFNLKMPVTYLASTGAATDVGTNNVWCFAICNNATCTVRHQCTVTYTDN